ncbi:MAG: DNA-binding protein [Bacteroidetes bacterium GWF2_40_14]|nr:MAG: DNA-binding protein [Bacteroidetes bacterium GWF2_40_14]
MKSPITGKEMVLIRENRTLSFRKEEFEVVYHHYKCEESGEFFTTTELDEINLNQLYNQYRAEHKLPFPEEIKQIRETYDLPASKMSEILGFGVNSYRNYESGEVPNQSNAKLIQLAADPKEFRKLIELSDAYQGKALDKILHSIDSLIHEQKQSKGKTQIENYLIGLKAPCSITGFKRPDFEKFTEMVVFFTAKQEQWKTKLNKLLFYADFSMYAQSGMSISGVQYRAIPKGPVPKNYQGLFEYLVSKEDIIIEYETFTSGNMGELFKPNPNRPFKSDLFSQKELLVLEEISQRFSKTTTQEIVDASHKEKAWIENSEGNKIIDYKYGFELNYLQL